MQIHVYLFRSGLLRTYLKLEESYEFFASQCKEGRLKYFIDSVRFESIDLLLTSKLTMPL